MDHSYKEVNGDLIKLTKDGHFDVITHGCNCFCTMGAGIAPQMAKHFGCNNYPLEKIICKGDINKLGCIEFEPKSVNDGNNIVNVVNAYTQYYYGKPSPGCNIPLDYLALKMCFRKMNHIFKGSHIGLPQIGCGLAGGDWTIVKDMIQEEFKDCKVTVVIYNK